MSASASHGRQLEVLVSFATDLTAPPNTSVSFLADRAPRVNNSASPFTVGLQLNTGGGTYTRVHINGTAAAASNGSMTIMQVRFSSFTLALLPIAGKAWGCSSCQGHSFGPAVTSATLEVLKPCVPLLHRLGCMWIACAPAATQTAQQRVVLCHCHPLACRQIPSCCVCLWTIQLLR